MLFHGCRITRPPKGHAQPSAKEKKHSRTSQLQSAHASIKGGEQRVAHSRREARDAMHDRIVQRRRAACRALGPEDAAIDRQQQPPAEVAVAAVEGNVDDGAWHVAMEADACAGVADLGAAPAQREPKRWLRSLVE